MAQPTTAPAAGLQARTAMGEEPLDRTLRCLADPHRRAILRLVKREEMAAGQIAAHFDVSRPAISQHLSLLRGAGLVTERRQGTRRLYRADRDGLEPLRSLLAEMWATGLERAAEIAEGTQHPGRSGRRGRSAG